MRFEGSRVAALSLERSSSDRRVRPLESCVRCCVFHLFGGELASVSGASFELGRVRHVFFGRRCVKPLRLPAIGQVVLFVLALPFKPGLRWLITALMRDWPLLLYFIRLVVGLIAALDDLRVVMRLHHLRLLPLPSLRRQLIRPVELTVGGPRLKLDALLGTAMLA